MRGSWLSGVVGLVGLFVLTGCGDDDSSTVPSSTSGAGAGAGGIPNAGPRGGGTATDGESPWGGAATGSDGEAGAAGHSDPIAVAVGYGALRLRSLDSGRTWQDVQEDDPDGGDDKNLLRDVTWAQGLFVAVGWRILVSTDGRDWEEHTLEKQNWCGGVAYGNGTFLCVGGCGQTLVSEDGRQWTKAGNASPGECGHLRSLAFGNGAFVAVGDDDRVAVTADGAEWTQAGPESLRRVFFRQGEFVATCSGRDCDFHATSPDGLDWTRAAGATHAAEAGEGYWLRRASGGRIERSTNLSDWTSVYPGGNNAIQAFAFSAPD